MANARSAVSSLALRLTRSQTSRSIGNISKRVHIKPQIHYKYRQGLFTQAHPNQPFMSSPPNQSGAEQPRASSIGIEWDNLSDERKTQWLLNNAGDTKWGWVFYRSCYKPELDTAWECIKSATEATARSRVATSDAPDILDRMDWVFVEDREALDGAPREELKRRFRDWARAENPGWDIDGEKGGRGARYSFFIQVDEAALLSIAAGGNGRPYVNIVRGWEDTVRTESADELGSNSEDWMKIQTDILNVSLYIKLDNDEAWYTIYIPPDGILSR